MNILGISASVALPHENMFHQLGISGSGHDSAAVLITDGKVIAAVEQERLDRIKHSNKSPIQAVRYCLGSNGLTLDDIDYIAVNYKEFSINLNLQEQFLNNPLQPDFYDLRYYIKRMLYEALGQHVDDSKLIFVSHNEAHAESAHAMSGFDDCLVLVTDGMGDDSAGMVQSRRNGKSETLYTIPVPLSLGNFYIQSIRYLGYGANDEYKVMGLAPYGDPQKYKRYFNKIVQLLPEGKYVINDIYPILFGISKPRRKGEAFTKVHQDMAAGIQTTLEEIIMHLLSYYKAETGHSKLCFAGGVAHNCSANGKIVYSGLFEEVFVQPAAHDAGAVLGAALSVWNRMQTGRGSTKQMDSVYWGPDIGSDSSVHSELQKWKDFIEFEKSENIIEDTADLLAAGKILGWVQGASEFGPRALGNRSILADPRPAENKQIINQMVKKREGYRPFAPSVLEEHLAEYFRIPDCNAQYSFMNYVLDVKEEKQKLLGAVTHVDGTARIQTVSKQTNPKYWELIHQFSQRTGVHILLNTSFNNHAEPIVDSVADAIVCYLTTKLHYLVVGDYIISKKIVHIKDYYRLAVSIPKYVELNKSTQQTDSEDTTVSHYLTVNYDDKAKITVSERCSEFLGKTDGKQTIEDILSKDKDVEDGKAEELVSELLGLWDKRLVIMQPEAAKV
ncbi:carbamoyltransferase [Paenibacillus tepidiphilus]|uniref:carbamoyltransferase family protein n=1 Tax=Paenibacillus tepidiphilus TaxID=2608683 RepID=UPI00123B461F|nr:carbamoyltransferase C-terminal domain-containing protein [Paenibacillus tepidiphilus]